jgi:hypothetical protein
VKGLSEKIINLQSAGSRLGRHLNSFASIMSAMLAKLRNVDQIRGDDGMWTRSLRTMTKDREIY